MLDEANRLAERPGFPVAPESGPLPLRGDPITGDRYYSREVAQAEWDRMWTRVWHVGGRTLQIEEPGDFIAPNFLRESGVLIDERDGSVRAFHNSCRHCGNRLVWTQSGGVSRGLACADHGWLWGLDGQLLDVQDPEDFPRGNPCGRLRLKKVACATAADFVAQDSIAVVQQQGFHSGDFEDAYLGRPGKPRKALPRGAERLPQRGAVTGWPPETERRDAQR